MHGLKTMVLVVPLIAPAAVSQPLAADRGQDCSEPWAAEPTGADAGQDLTDAYAGVTLTNEDPAAYPDADTVGYIPDAFITAVSQGGFALGFTGGGVAFLGDYGVFVATFDPPATSARLSNLLQGSGILVMRAYDASGVQIDSATIGNSPFDSLIGESLSVEAPGIAFIAAYSIASSAGFSPDALEWTTASVLDGDENEDGVVDFTDLLNVLVNYGAACGE